MHDDCIFCQIIDGKVPSDKIFESSEVLAFKDIDPQAPTHIVIVPKEHHLSLMDVEEGSALLAKLLSAAQMIAKEQGLDDDGFRVVINTGVQGGQTVDHLHLHLLGGRSMQWPPG